MKIEVGMGPRVRASDREGARAPSQKISRFIDGTPGSCRPHPLQIPKTLRELWKVRKMNHSVSSKKFLSGQCVFFNGGLSQLPQFWTPARCGVFPWKSQRRE